MEHPQAETLLGQDLITLTQQLECRLTVRVPRLTRICTVRPKVRVQTCSTLDSRIVTRSLMGFEQGQTADVTHTLTASLSAEMRCRFPQSFSASRLLNPKCVPTGTQSAPSGITHICCILAKND